MTKYALTDSSESYQEWRVWKFGGSSLKDAKKIVNVRNLVLQDKGDVEKRYCRNIETSSLMVVVSAVAGVTKSLCKLCALDFAHFNLDFCNELIQNIIDIHVVIIDDLIENYKALNFKLASFLTKKITNDCENKLKQVFKTCSLLGFIPSRLSEYIKGYGELWSSYIVYEVINYAYKQNNNETCDKVIELIDGSEVIVVKQNEKTTFTKVNWEKSGNNLLNRFKSLNEYICIMTGYICSLEDGSRGTLGRNGSDFTGAIVANILSARCFLIWSDVEGVYTADPRIVKSSICVKYLTYLSHGIITLWSILFTSINDGSSYS